VGEPLKCSVRLQLGSSATGDQMADKHHGLYRAIVLNNSDPQLEFRLQLIAREVSSVPLFWAEACVPSDQVTLPGIGDTVWVMFEAGDIQKPVWVGVRPRRTA